MRAAFDQLGLRLASRVSDQPGEVLGGQFRVGFAAIDDRDEQEAGQRLGVADVGHRGSVAPGRLGIAEGALDVGAIHAARLHLGHQIVGPAAPGHHAAKIAGAKFDLGQIARIEGQERHQVAAGGMAHHHDLVARTAELRGMVINPADRGGYVVDVGRMLNGRRQAIIGVTKMTPLSFRNFGL